MADNIEFNDAGANPGPGPETSFPSSTSSPSSSSLPEETHRPKGPAFQIVAGLVAIGALLIAGVLVGRKEAQVAAPAPATASTPADAKAAAPAPETPDGPATSDAHAPGGDIKEIQSQLDGLSAQLKELQEKVDALPRPEPAPDLKPIRSKVDDLARSVAAILPLGDKVDKLDATVKSIKDDLSGLTAEVKKPAAAAPAAEEPRPASSSAPAFSEGVDLFKAAKYKEAADVFKKAESANPKDARVYYYQALANALASGKWRDPATLALARKGAELEKSGATKATEVDAAFADLPANLKPWLAFFRSQAK